MSYPKLAQLVTKLAKLTERGRITWEPTSVRDQYQVSFSDYSVLLSTTTTDLAEDIVVTVVNSEGEIIESVRDPELVDFFSPQTPYSVMAEMYGIARRQAMGVEGALDSILNDLEAKSDPNDDIPF